MKTIHAALVAVLLAGSIPLAPASAAEPTNVSKSGIPYRPDSDAAGPAEVVGPIRARRPEGKLLNLDRMLLHSPSFAQAWNTMFGTIRQKLAVPARLRELAIMSIGVLNHADYEWFQHEGEFLKAGGTKEQLAALKNPSAALKDSKHFDEAELATLALTSEMTHNIQVKPATMKRIRAVLPDDQVVELIGTIAGYNMVSRFAVATGLEPEAS
ncbi:MAG TPA: carboxymuconolactone decarboxylase family protein [Myxococcaceae bacterium]|jgi:alkylhydroperoxidase family enzyme|nr:carboxymuconolactone decarboxylase family protein [Myxococcaceae bacterium]